jgi:uncharacterized membrane protein YdjX (TVP38/TMEM64 family)
MWRKVSIAVLLVLAAAVGILLAESGEAISAALDWARANPGPSSIAFVLIYVLGAVILTPSWILTVAAGYLFGWAAGAVLVSVASLAGALAAFFLGRYLARDWVERRVDAMPRFSALDRAISKKGFMVVLLIRLSLVFPYNLMNYVLGVTSVSVRPYALATWLGMIPAVLVYVSLGSGLGSAAALLSGDLETGPLGQALAVLGLAVLAGLIWYLARLATRVLQEELENPGEVPLAQPQSGSST